MSCPVADGLGRRRVGVVDEQRVDAEEGPVELAHRRDGGVDLGRPPEGLGDLEARGRREAALEREADVERVEAWAGNG